MLAYFKQKEYKDRPVFTVSFMPLIHDLLNQLAATEPIAKFESESKEPLKSLPQLSNILKLDSFELKALSKESHIQ